MLHNFRSYRLAVLFYKETKTTPAPRHLRDQLLRASSSIALNLSEGSAKSSRADRKRFYEIALGSVRECEAILTLLDRPSSSLDTLARHVFSLVRSLQ